MARDVRKWKGVGIRSKRLQINGKKWNWNDIERNGKNLEEWRGHVHILYSNGQMQTNGQDIENKRKGMKRTWTKNGKETEHKLEHIIGHTYFKIW